MIVVTGAAGFIGSALVHFLNRAGFDNVLAVDDFSRADKNKNLDNKQLSHKIERFDFLNRFDEFAPKIKFIFHLGARTDTTEFDYSIFEKLNISYTQQLWKYCVNYQIPLVYASSAATYGLGELGYKDSEDIVGELKPLNPYGRSKNEVDIWVLAQEKTPPFWAGLKFFNVYGANEYHKGRMASVIFHAFHQIQNTGSMKLFRSHHPDFEDGKQLRDFIYVKDVAQVCLFLMENQPQSGLYNLGTGQARTFLDLVKSTFKALEHPEKISFIDTPADIRDKYQYFTEANMTKLRAAGYQMPFTSLEEGVIDYVKNYLTTHQYL